MKTILAVIMVLALLLTGAAQKVDVVPALQSLVDTERAFSRASGEKGTRESFLMFIADDGILFRPAAVAGKKWMLEHPQPPNPKRPLLSWQPIFADIAVAGDMGYTTGPWEFKQDINDEKAVAFGNFITVWKKQPDGTWKFAIDLGISNPQPAAPATPWKAPASRLESARKTMGSPALDSARSALAARDREFSEASAKHGAAGAFKAYAADDVRLFRNDSFPFVGSYTAAAMLATNKDIWSWKPDFADISRSGDLGYTYGTYELRSGDAAKTLTGKGNYLRIWKREGGVLKVVVDVADPQPLEKKN